MAENFGGPVWHASGSTTRGDMLGAKSNARAALSGVGDVALGEWQYQGERAGIWHVIRRLSAEERETFGVPEPYDIRGTDEELRRIEAVYAEAPYLRSVMPHVIK